MPNQLHLRASYEVDFERPNTRLYDESFGKEYKFFMSRGGQNIEIKTLQDGKTIEAHSVLHHLDPTILTILSTHEYDKLDSNEKLKIDEIANPIEEATKQFVALLKQELKLVDINDSLIRPVRLLEWSLDDKKYQSLNRKWPRHIPLWFSSVLDDSIAQHLQQLLSENEEMLIATMYLHQARKTMNTRYKWIHTTIAAELAIKEVLIRVEPILQVILQELQSPPLAILYGSVLESVVGIKLPPKKLNKLKDGSRIRNNLLHSPRTKAPSFQDAEQYLNFVDDTITWLLNECRKVRRKSGHSP